MTVIVEWFGETGRYLSSAQISIDTPADAVREVRNYVGRQFKVSGNPYTVAVISVGEVDSHEWQQLDPEMQHPGRFVVTNATQGNWGNGREF